MRTFLLLVSLVAVLGYLAPFHPAPEGAAVAGQYIVVFSPNATQASVDKHLGQAPGLRRTFNIGGTFRGYSAQFTDAQLQSVREEETVAYVDADQTVHVIACQQQANAEWNLDRASARTAPDMSGIYQYETTRSGQQVDVYVIDTGIRVTHVEFAGGRAVWGTNTVGDGNNSDCHGHGTHVAGTVGGTLYGVAKNVKLIAVKVLGCGGGGTFEGVIAGINWTANQHTASGKKISVLNMSLGGGYHQATNDATDAAVRAGVVAAVASGNSNADACNFTPASSPLAIGAVASALGQDGGNQVDVRAPYSNYGQCTHIVAPGSAVKSAHHTSDTATATMSGTSMASPHVAGVAAVLISGDASLDTPAKVLAQMQATSGKDLVRLNCVNAACERTPNLHLFSAC